MVEPKLINACDADFDEIALFQQWCFQTRSGASERTTVQTPSYYLWKYTIIGPAKIAQLRREGALVAMCAAFPVQLSASGVRVTGWQICDIATKPSERRKGFFQACLQVLSDSLSPADVFFGFPNRYSAPLLAERGWQAVETLTSFAGIIPNARPIDHVHRLDRFGEAQDTLVGNLKTSDRLTIIKSSTYMNARYCSAHRPIYVCCALSDCSDYRGWIVLRTLNMFGVRVCIIMDFFAVDAVAKRMLLQHAGSWSRQQRCVATISFNNKWGRFDLLRHGLVAIPSMIVPRPLVLMTARTAGLAGASRWLSYVGDWDGM